MYTEKECLDFFKNLKNFKHIKKDFSYDEYEIINELASSAKTESFIRTIYNNNKDLILNNSMLQFYIMNLKSTPIDIIEDIIKDVMSVPILLKAFNNENIAKSPNSDKIYNYIVNSLFEMTLEEHICREIKSNNDKYKEGKQINNTLFSENAIKYLHSCMNNKFLPIHITKDNEFAIELLNKYPDDENLRTEIANNVKLDEKIRNRAFDEGCVFEKIVMPTPHMSFALYESAIETLSMVDKVDEPNFQSSKRVIENLINNYSLNESQQLDIVMRYANDKRAGYSWVYDTLCNFAVDESIFEKIVELVGHGDANSVYIRDVYKAPFMPDKFVAIRAENAIKEYEKNEMLGIDSESVINKALTQTCIDKKELYEILLKKNHIGFFDSMAQCYKTPNDILEKIIEKTVNTNKSNIAIKAALNIAMNSCDEFGKKHKSLYFIKAIMSINKLDLKTYHNVLKEKDDKFDVSVFAHNIFNDVNKKCLINYFETAKELLKANKETEKFMNNFISRYKESFLKDDIYTKVNIEVSSYSGEFGETMFERKTLNNIFSASDEKLDEFFNSLSFPELLYFNTELMQQIARVDNIDDFVTSENWCNLYENANSFIRVHQKIEHFINEKEKTYEKGVEVDER